MSTMMGSYLMIYPLIYKQFGIATVQIAFTFLTLVNYKTACLILLHTRQEENDFNESIQRHLPKYIHKIFCISGSFNSFALSTSYYMFFINVAYKMVEFVTHHLGSSIVSKDKFTLEEFSFQYMSLIGLGVLVAVLSVGKLSLIMKFASFAFLGAIVYMTYLFTLMVSNLQHQLNHS